MKKVFAIMDAERHDICTVVWLCETEAIANHYLRLLNKDALYVKEYTVHDELSLISRVMEIIAERDAPLPERIDL